MVLDAGLDGGGIIPLVTVVVVSDAGLDGGGMLEARCALFAAGKEGATGFGGGGIILWFFASSSLSENVGTASPPSLAVALGVSSASKGCSTSIFTSETTVSPVVVSVGLPSPPCSTGRRLAGRSQRGKDPNTVGGCLYARNETVTSNAAMLQYVMTSGRRIS